MGTFGDTYLSHMGTSGFFAVLCFLGHKRVGDFFLSFFKWIINTLLNHPIDELSISCDYKQCLYLRRACVRAQ